MASRLVYLASVGDSVTAAHQNEQPGGLIGRDSQVSNVGSISPQATICSVTVTVGASREILIQTCGQVSVNDNAKVSSGAIDDAHAPWFFAAIYNGGTLLNRHNYQCLAKGRETGFSLFVHDQPSSGSNTYNLVVGISGNSVPLVAIQASPTQQTLLYVSDVGPAF